MYCIYKLKIWNVVGLLKVSNILYACGKDMATKYDLHHWDNSRIKTWIIVLLCMLKNRIYLVFDNKIPVATFQTKKINDSYFISKAGTLPDFSGAGIGTFCFNEIERLAKSENCKDIIFEVYEKNEHAKTFFLNRGYFVYGHKDTLKYRELKLRKYI